MLHLFAMWKIHPIAYFVLDSLMCWQIVAARQLMRESGKVQKELERVEEIESMNLKQLRDMDCNLDVIKKCDGCDLWYMQYDTELRKMRRYCIKMQVAAFLLRRGQERLKQSKKFNKMRRKKN